MFDYDPHPGPLPSDGRGDGCRPSSVGGELHGLRSRRFSVRRRMVLPLLEERVGVRSSFPTDLRFMLDAGPHPGPLPSDWRGKGCCPSSVGGGLSGISSGGFSAERHRIGAQRRRYKSAVRNRMPQFMAMAALAISRSSLVMLAWRSLLYSRVRSLMN